MKSFLAAFLFLTTILPSAFGEAIVTLKSGEILQGNVLSDTNDVVQIRAYSKNRTISSRRDIPRFDIQSLQNETPVQAAERETYFALSKFQLNPDQEQTTDFYIKWMAAFEKFQTDYPTSDKLPAIKQRLETYKAEIKHLESGEVKFANQWMSPEKKTTLVKQKEIQTLKEHLAKSQIQRQQLNDQLPSLQKSLIAAQQALETAKAQPPRQEPIYEAVKEQGHWRDQPDRIPAHYWVIDTPAHTRISGHKTVPPSTSGAQANVTKSQQQLAKAQADIASLDQQNNGLKSQIPKLEQEYQVAFAKANPPEPVIAEAAVTEPPATVQEVKSPPKTEPRAPWYTRFWDWL